jgi:mono/diheme cytochrome c family protein
MLVNTDRSGYPVPLMRRARRVVVLGSLALVVGCTRPLPDADSPGAQLYQARCGTCHVSYQPRTLTAAMWELQVERMRETLRRSGVSPLTEEEEGLLLGYLRAHATDAGVQP